jgi:hypothetical protein
VNEDELRARVAREREARGYFSIRAAARAAEACGARVSYTTWSDWENGRRPLGDVVRRAVMLLFGWPADWPENPPDDRPPGGDTDGEITRLAAEIERQRAELDAVHALLARVTETLQRISTTGDVRGSWIDPTAG